MEKTRLGIFGRNRWVFGKPRGPRAWSLPPYSLRPWPETDNEVKSALQAAGAS